MFSYNVATVLSTLHSVLLFFGIYKDIVTIDTMNNSNRNLQGNTISPVNILMNRTIILQIKVSTEHIYIVTENTD